ncbi:hypothetical protein A3I95_01235 [Candidatus Nomurabacteria bacterium RIFCSPLOWO2_02_FULL_44_12]|uniref:Uncharacterized protein n=1 Tax=Candidatus Nomurabacteria bacterium RIFCSPLOWO2_12_FULL_44_11 TaxID=1801796 RepID=A0A1F6Y6X1_9BACT|nr:MAG: hypothetical protein A3E95_02160 [Candidatus Nomurabacteria bacterium RIFCSPHIGHO2_12_FULL_44_22b]OGJ02118.1 MAG: hypothetical protein A3G53_00380 [Candidatus Nomurabacteria bacterium RIFCSPLOWO2_12_FULL_44_11]OGJ08664.1 MAG: hypothetical protein A3I95_01235 [Candidatus Nomurabacteria bacterium RIFCSPLOWO2_02_FULL_44_12]
MSAIAIKMKSYAENMDTMLGRNLSSILRNALLCSLGALAVFYVLLLGNMVINIIERRSLEAEARVLEREVGDLELNYLSLSKKVDLSLSRSLGFKEIKATFATRQSLGSAKVVKNEI